MSAETLTVNGMRIVVHPDCPGDRAYLVNETTLGTLLQHPAIAKAAAEGVDPFILAPNREIAEKVATAVQSVGRIDL